MEVGVEHDRDFAQHASDVAAVRRYHVDAVVVHVVDHQVSRNAKHLRNPTVLHIMPLPIPHVHAQTVSVRCDVTDHLSLLDVPNLVPRVDGKPVHSVVDIARSSKQCCTRIALRSNDHGVDLTLGETQSQIQTRSFSSSFFTK